MIKIQNLTVSYGKNIILENLKLELQPTHIHGLIGLNGSGKTTLLNTLYGLNKPDAGEIFYEQKKLTRKNIAFLPTQNFFYSRITGEEYLRLFQTQNQQFSIQDWNEIFELPLKKLIEDYSTGMKKKLALLGILSLNRPIFILDEPSNGLDLESNQILKKIMLRLKETGKTILITSHILEMLWTVCDVIHHLENKKIQQSYTASEFQYLENQLFNYHHSQEIQLQKLLF